MSSYVKNLMESPSQEGWSNHGNCPSPWFIIGSIARQSALTQKVMIYDTRMTCQVRTDCLITYAQNCYEFSLTPLQKQMMQERMAAAAGQKYSGLLTIGSRKRISRAIDLLIQIAKPVWGINEVTKRKQKHVLSYITLTVPGNKMISAQEGYDKLLKHYLQWLRRTKGVKSYVWKAEFQTRGQLHYHITSPAWIHYTEIRDKWNNLLRSSGLLKEYFDKQGHYNPNSTDIHQVKKIENLAGYLKKEFCKTVQNQKTTGKVWDCSINLKCSKYFELELDLQLLNKIHADVLKGNYEVIELDQCKIYKATDRTKVQQPFTLQQVQQYKSYLEHITTYSRPETKKQKI